LGIEFANKLDKATVLGGVEVPGIETRHAKDATPTQAAALADPSSIA